MCYFMLSYLVTGLQGVIVLPKKKDTRKRPERKSTVDRFGNSLVDVVEDVRVVPPSHLLKEQGCASTGGGFLKALNKFLDDYYTGKVVLGRSREMSPIEWEFTGVDRSYHRFFMTYPPIIRRDPFTVFKEQRVVKR